MSAEANISAATPLDRVIRRATEQMMEWCEAHLGEFPSPIALDDAVETAVPIDEVGLHRLARERRFLRMPVEGAISPTSAIRVNVLDLVEREVLEAIAERHVSMRDRSHRPSDGPERGA